MNLSHFVAFTIRKESERRVDDCIVINGIDQAEIGLEKSALKINCKLQVEQWDQKTNTTKSYLNRPNSVPDLRHREQLSEGINSVDMNFKTREGAIKESFLGSIKIHSNDDFL